ncbi:protein CYSTEINE-RICH TRANSMEMBRANE MODULE 4-like [Wolffia australiana]
MSYYDQQKAAPAVYPPPPAEAYPAYVAPPPAGYPTKDQVQYSSTVPAETRSRGDGFWKGCCAALCCCCLVDMCF